MFEAMGYTDAEELDRMQEACLRYFEEQMPTGAFRVWVACVSGADGVSAGDEADSGQAGTCGEESIADGDASDGEPIASIGLVVHSVPPSPLNLVGKVGYIMNLVTLPEHRRQGIGADLLECVINVVRSEGIPIANLHATAAGRGIYERAGFRLEEGLPEMWLDLAGRSP
jgi:GNAT superfamily N-acetyltransferase